MMGLINVVSFWARRGRARSMLCHVGHVKHIGRARHDTALAARRRGERRQWYDGPDMAQKSPF